MPQQFFQNDYVAQAAPIQRGISNLTNDITTGIKDVTTAYNSDQAVKQAQQANLSDYNSLKAFFEPAGVQADWNSLAPRPSESNEQYRARIKTETMPLFDQLDQKGFDPREISVAAKIPGFTFEQLAKIRDKRIIQDTSANLKGELPEGAKQAIQQGVMSIDDINKKYGTSLTREQYDANAGFGIYKPAGNGVDVGGMAPQSEVDAAVAPQPISYQRGREIVDNANLPADQKTTFNPQLQSIADRDASKLVTPDQTTIGYYGGMQKQGLPLTPIAEKVGGAITADANLDFKRDQERRKAKGSDNSLLQSMLKASIFQQTMAEKYGDKGIKMANDLYNLTVKRNDLEQRAQRAESGIHERGKLPEDPQIIYNQMQIVDNEIDRMQSTIPGFDRMKESYLNDPMSIRNFNFNSAAPGATPKPVVTTKPKDPLGIR